MKVLACDFLKTNKGYNVGMCVVSNEGENRIKHFELFERDCKLEDIAGFIIDKFKLLKCDYVVIEELGLGGIINDILKYELGDKVKIHRHTYKEEHETICNLCKSKILEELGLQLKYYFNNDFKFEFNRKEYTDFEYLMVKSIGMANKLLNEIKEKPINDKVSLGDLTKAIEINVLNALKSAKSEYHDKLKDSNINITLNVSSCRDSTEIKEKLLSDLNHALEVIKDIDKII